MLIAKHWYQRSYHIVQSTVMQFTLKVIGTVGNLKGVIDSWGHLIFYNWHAHAALRFPSA